MASKSAKSSPRTVSSAKRGGTTKKSGGGSWGGIWKPTKTGTFKSRVAPSTTNVGTRPASPVIPAGMPSPVAQAVGQAAAKKGGQIKKAAAPVVAKAAPVYSKALPVAKSAYSKSLPAVGPTYTKSLPPSNYTKSLPKTSLPGGSNTGGGTSGGGGTRTGGGSTTTTGTAPAVTTTTPPARPATTPPTTAAGTTQSGSFNTRGDRTYGQFARKRQSRGPRSGLSMTPQMLMRLAGQRITNPR